MTNRELYLKGKRELEKAGIETPAFDAACLFEYACGLSRQERVVHGAETPEPARTQAFLEAVRQRAQHRPLQYILGEWEFMGLSLSVGEGVLVPRGETELLVRAAAEQVQGKTPRLADLCAGSGAVALGLLSLLPGASVSCLELMPGAFSYLEENICRFGGGRARALRLDVLSPQSAARFTNLDAVVSNPPYVETGALPGLQEEVRREPETALDGGADGLLFYRAIAKHWVPRLAPGGVAAVEIGEAQGRQVSELWRRAGLSNVRVLRDFNDYDRVVIGQKP